MKIYSWLHSVWKNHPQGVATFSKCECGRSSRRGGEPCLECLSDKLVNVAGVDPVDIRAFFATIKTIRVMENSLITQVGGTKEL